MLKLGVPFSCEAQVLRENGVTLNTVEASIAAIDVTEQKPAAILQVLKHSVTVTCDGVQVKLANQIRVPCLPKHIEAFSCFSVDDGPFAYSRCIVQKAGTGARKKKGSDYGQFAAAVSIQTPVGSDKRNIVLLLVTGVKVVFFASFLFSLC
jgi:hypothetical protein